ncbi:bifunctional (p)ppGpp synthetase/guanosine-3',5'-bis(diphosphate) 3'-pyrophosphohydrolase [Algiphilus sp.]|nr:bifunctional (p)ppGpp synthetase/guanosine-3',5'-bis(diphosphate) 3'-pyrophosphohydrolase [Algiphilus sp.]MBY8966270.1 bifunctional (p)ppGpp synthetase/guanosine-3',5'-bis(diphosphate) 3'-pyrophosphohydrolase [Algiphilus acroporae]MCI5104306.1 bifunctional (p)ppGpp synthetase/guanosine-3',5'-bis(diphosphate) 3'-pyrophosphohydrolase [Algiphilus sp.]
MTRQQLPVIGRIGNALRAQRVARTFGIDALARVLETYMTADQVDEVRRAHALGQQVHSGQMRSSGEPYIYHPLAVARILAEMRLDHVTIIAAILHDAIEDTEVTKEELAADFGDDVAELVDGVSKFDRAEGVSRAQAQAESVRKLLMAMTKDLRVILIKLADRLHNMRTLGAMEDKKRRRKARETLEVYAPIAHRLGIHFLRVELEELAFQNLYPQRYRVIERSVRQQLGNSRKTIAEIEGRLARALRDEGIGATVVGRQKNLYSIYEKMRRKKLKLPSVMDILGFRVIVSKVDECYRALGMVHHIYRPISELFNDYIANPKSNGYQSLHTTCMGPHGRKIEVQIRTREMHHIAESGIAAHWQYKLGASGQQNAPETRAREWLSSLFELQDSAAAVDFFETVKIDLFPDEVYVFTPKGKILRMPRGATAVDFAYAVHSELGDRCVAARIDQQLEPLSAELQNGQTVEIITARHAQPNAAWLNFVKTAKARSSIRHYLRNQRTDEAIRLGKRLLERAIRGLNLTGNVLRGEAVERVLELYKLDDLEALYAEIGLGKRLAPVVARHFVPESEAESTQSDRDGPALAVQGTEGLVLNYGKCCHPLPGDEIRGHVSAGRGLIIHRSQCREAMHGVRVAPQDWIPLVWSEEVEGHFGAELRVKALNERGALAAIAAEIASADSSIENVQMSDRHDDESADIRFVIAVGNRTHLAQVLRRVRRLSVVARAWRT